MVGLSDLDSKRFNAVIRFKASIQPKLKELCPANSLSFSPRKHNVYGEIEADRIFQHQKRSFSEEEITALVSAYRDGKTTYELAEDFRCHRRTIGRVLKRQGITVTKAKAQQKLDPSDVISMYAQMHTTEEIAKKYTVNPQAIIKCLRAHNIGIRSRWDYKKLD